MKNHHLLLLILAVCATAPAHAGEGKFPAIPQPARKPEKAAPPLPVTPGSQLIWFKTGEQVEIRPDKSVWWFGANQKKALVSDGTHVLKDGQKITTRGGKLTSKQPRPMKPPEPKKPAPKAPKTAP